jgi:hypothetical protein
MFPSAPVSPVREILKGRLSVLSQELEQLFDEQLTRQIASQADRLNEAVRRIRLAPDSIQLGAALVDGAGTFASGVALLRISDSHAIGERARGVPPEQSEAFRELRIPLDTAPALGEAARGQDPVTALCEAAQVSPQLAALSGDSSGRVVIYPVVVRGHARTILYVWGAAQTAAAELLTQLASAVWSSMPEPAGLAQIRTNGARSAWEALPPEEQRIHLRAQRVARVDAAEMRLYETDAVASGRARRDLYGQLRERIDRARETFHKTFFEGCPSMVDYLHLELLHTLANDDPELLGKEYPGPLV